MTLAQVETRVLNFLGPDAVESPFVQADTWAIINECYLEYIARFTGAWITSTPTSTAAVAFTLGTTAEGQWIECETLEVWNGVTNDPDTGLPVYTPLKRRTEGQILFMARTEGAIRRPDRYSLALKNRSLSLTRSQFTARVYPIPDQAYTYRARVRTWPTTELTAGGDVLQQIDDEQGEHIAQWVACRMGLTLGFDPEVVGRLIASLPDKIKAEFDIYNTLNWPFSTPRRVGELVEGVA